MFAFTKFFNSNSKQNQFDEIELNDLKQSQSQVTELNDDLLKKTYTYFHPRLKTNLLGLEKDSTSQFKIVPLNISFSEINHFALENFFQTNIPNCSFLAAMRSIVRRYPNHLQNVFIEETHNDIILKLYKKSKESNAMIPNFYKIQKSMVLPIHSNFTNTVINFCANKKHPLSPWLKVLEKALVLSYMEDESNYRDLMRHQLDDLKDKQIPSYEDVLEIIGLGYTYQALLGTKANRNMLNFDEYENMFEEIKTKLLSGKLITADFINDSHQLFQHHQYEIVNLGVDLKTSEKYILLSNPWGFNNFYDLLWGSKVNTSSLEMILHYPCIIEKDDGLLMVPFSQFQKNVKYLVCTGSSISMEYKNLPKNDVKYYK